MCSSGQPLRKSIDEAVVATAVERLFTGEQGKQDNNLQFVHDMLSKTRSGCDQGAFDLPGYTLRQEGCG